MAAWRSGGFSALLFKSALPAAVAPNRSLAAVHCASHFVQSTSVRFVNQTGTEVVPVKYTNPEKAIQKLHKSTRKSDAKL
jgi:hypothetical protein